MAGYDAPHPNEPGFDEPGDFDVEPFGHYDADARDDGGFTGLHFSNLFDQDHDEAGDRYDLATGRPYDNSTDTLEDMGLHVVDDENEDDAAEGIELVNHWAETQEGLARAAGLLPPFADEDIA